MGTSLGASASITAAAELPEISAVIALSAFADFTDMAVEVMPKFGIPKFIARIDKPFLKIVIGFRLGFGNLKYSPINAVKKPGFPPLLLMHSTDDDQVPYPQFEKLLATAQSTNVQVTSLAHKSNEHLVFADITEPTKDAELSQAILNFIREIDNYAKI